MARDLNIHLDISDISRRLNAYESALRTFCGEFRSAKPDLIAEAESALDEIAANCGVPTSVFTSAKRALRGEELET